MNDDISQNHLFVSLKHEFMATRIVGSQIYPSVFKMKVDLSPIDDGSKLFPAKMEATLNKLDFWVNKVLDKSVILDYSNDWAISSFVQNNNPIVNNPVVLCPDEPSDAVLCELFISKFRAIAGDIFEFHSIELESNIGKGLSYMFVGEACVDGFSDEEWLGENNFFSRPWWHRNDASAMDICNEVELTEEMLANPPKWAYSLNFISDRVLDQESLPNNVVVRAEFRPKVIQGGKTE